jgi:hypothetical protein
MFMRVRHALAAAVLVLFGCASEKTMVSDAAREMVANENAAQGDAPRTISSGPVVFASEYSTFAWYGSTRWQEWFEARRRYEAQNGISHAQTSVLGIKHVEIRDRAATVVLEEALVYEKNGRKIRERGLEAFSLNGFGAPWRIEGYARLNEGEIAEGPVAEAVLSSAQDLIRWLNTDRIVPVRLVDSALIEDDLQDWQRTAPGGDVQDPHRAPLMPGDPDMQIVLGRPLRLEIGRSDAFVVFAATLQSKTGHQIKGRGRLGLVLGSTSIIAMDPVHWGFEEIAWAPE